MKTLQKHQFFFIINDLKTTIGFSEKYIFAKPLSKEDQELKPRTWCLLV